MIKWCDNLYMDDIIRKKENKVKKALEKNKVSLRVYVIALASNPSNLFDIINANELLFLHYRKSEIKIVGLASSKEAAIELVKDIILTMYQQTKVFEPSNYFHFLSE